MTSYDKETHTVKGIVMPHGIETGNVAIRAMHTSGEKGTGTFIGPTPGTAQSLQNGGQFDGDIMEIHFDGGDPNTIGAYHKMSQPDNPPQVESGEHLVQHEKGSSHLYKKDGSVVFTHFAAQGSHTWDKDGNLTTDTKGKTHTIKSSGGAIYIDGGGGNVHVNEGSGS